MGRTLVHVSMSLDGFIAGPDHSMDWIFDYAGPNAEVDDVIATTGAILSGRRCYDVGRDTSAPEETNEPFGGAWSGPQFVLTHNPPADETDPSIRFLDCPVAEAVATAHAAAGGGNVLILGANVVQQCLDAGLVDDVLIHIAPVLIGEGTRLFGPVARHIKLEPVSVTRAGKVANLRFALR
ncbi:dihydrofolate reductase family protein [Saccharomonospora sp. NPDC006951]